MKRKISFLATFAAASAMVSALTLSSCVHEPNDALAYVDGTTDSATDDTKISLIGSTSRAVVNDLLRMEGDTNGFGVYAIANNYADGFYLGGDAYACSGGVWGWKTSSNNHSWPSETTNYPLSFYAYYPESDAAVAISSDFGKSLVTGTVTIQDVALQTDLLAASSSTDMRPVGGAISMTFDHILSQISLSVKAGSNSDVHVQSVSFKGMVGMNDFEYTTMSWATLSADASDENVVYPYVAAHRDATVIGSISGGALNPDNGPLMLMPQTLAHWDTENGANAVGARVVIVYRVTKSDCKDDVLGFSSADYTVQDGEKLNGPLFIKVGYPLKGTWEMGQSYNYVVELGGSASSGGYYISNKYFDELGRETDVYIDETIEPGDTVYDEEINFTVDVNPWGSSTDVDVL